MMPIAFALCFVRLRLSKRRELSQTNPPIYSKHVFQELAGLIARGQEKQVGKRAVNFPNRIRRYVLSRKNFDEDDTQWLCTTISVFLVIIENSLSGRNKIDRLIESLL